MTTIEKEPNLSCAYAALSLLRSGHPRYFGNLLLPLMRAHVRIKKGIHSRITTRAKAINFTNKASL